MNLREIFNQTFSTLRAHKMRSFLTMFGIVWGIASVILLVGLGRGFSHDQKERMKTLGTDLVIIWGGRTSQQAGGYAAGRSIRLNIRDVQALKREAYLVERISPELRRMVPQVTRYNSASRAVAGIWPEYQEFRNLPIGQGRLLSQADEREARRVVVLGSKAREQLFRSEPALGETVKIAGVPYTVVGVLSDKKQNSSYSGRDNEQMFAPYSAVARDFPPPERPGIERGWISNIVFEVRDPEDHEAAVKQVRSILGRMKQFDKEDKDALFIWDTMNGAKMVQRIFTVMTVFFGAMAIMTLCLGGIGVMNIMLVSVTERTREIGVRKAIGATRRDILRQFFAESAIITAVSGALGFALGVGICVAMNTIPMPDFMPHPQISWIAIIGSLMTLSLITFTAGIYPASRAAEMDPIESLRYE